ncbi:MAG: hypothetical protein M1818_002670 [Claussenomyces sp. TS43310]|nr:MAG: hypothetical protein M1818_002670 [Claussenomyces sp. TS43310]
MTILQAHPPGQSTLPSANPTASFWLSDPSRILLGHRTTPRLPQTADVVIVGSGIAGAFAAHFLAEDEDSKDLDVVMLEAREVSSGATGRNGGHCQPKLYSKSTHLARFELANLNFLRKLVEDHRIPCEWQDVAGCRAYMTDAMFAAAVADVERLWREDAQMGSSVRHVSDRKQLKQMRLGSEVAGAIVQTRAATLWPYKLIAWVLESLLKTKPAGLDSTRGTFNLQTNTPVNTVQRLHDGSCCIHTPRGMLVTRQVLLATNAYTSHLLPKFSDLIVPVRGQMGALIPPLSMNDDGPLAGRNSYDFLGNGTQSSDKDEYLMQRPWSPLQQRGGELMLGGGRRFAAHQGVGVSDDSQIDDSTRDYLRDALNVVLDLGNEGEPLGANYEWSGIMGFSRDSAPWVGQVPQTLGGASGLWLCAGFTSHGMPNACLSARAAVREMMGHLVEDSELPPEFRITSERIENARQLFEVRKALALGAVPDQI